eukprot:8211545-Alexandrium_andersonii.AAC.1
MCIRDSPPPPRAGALAGGRHQSDVDWAVRRSGDRGPAPAGVRRQSSAQRRLLEALPQWLSGRLFDFATPMPD